MKLPEFIQSIGDAEFAKRFDVSERTAASYRLRQRLPKQELAQRVVENSPVTWEGIYAPDATPAAVEPQRAAVGS